MTNIVDFLLSRIAEDESGVRNGSAYWEGCYGDECHDRMLAECAAKRAIVALHGPVEDRNWAAIGGPNNYLWCDSCGSIDDSPEPYPCPTLKALAAVYASHPDYRQEWSVA